MKIRPYDDKSPDEAARSYCGSPRDTLLAKLAIQRIRTPSELLTPRAMSACKSDGP